MNTKYEVGSIFSIIEQTPLDSNKLISVLKTIDKDKLKHYLLLLDREIKEIKERMHREKDENLQLESICKGLKELDGIYDKSDDLEYYMSMSSQHSMSTYKLNKLRVYCNNLLLAKNKVENFILTGKTLSDEIARTLELLNKAKSDKECAH